MKMSPEPLPEMLPSRPSPRVARCAQALELSAERSGASVAIDNDDRAVLGHSAKKLVGVWILRFDFPADGNSGDAEILARAVVALHQNADGVAAIFDFEAARRRADAALESVANHSRAAANRALFDGPAVRGIDGVETRARASRESR